MNYETIDTQYVTCNTIDAEMIFVEDNSEITIKEQAEGKKNKAEKNMGKSKDEDVETWVNEKANKDCIRFFKPQFCMSPKYPELGLDAFFLVIMTKPQMEFLKKFHYKLVCVDRQVGENFEVVSLLILDDKEECLPCAFLFTSKVDPQVLKCFFSEIKTLIGKVETKLILSDKINDVGKVWDEVMETTVRSMICSWDVIKDWTFNLWSVYIQEKVHKTYKELEELIEEKDINTFTTKCEVLMNNLSSDPVTEEFGLYFSKNYAKNPQIWACCYRYEEEDSRGYYQLEKMHSIIHYILQTRTTKKLNRALDTTLDFLRNKIYDRLVLINNGKVAAKLAEIRHRHKNAEKVDYVIGKRGTLWTLTNGRKEKHIVTLCKGSCNCQTKCNQCDVCSHTYICSCIDSVIRLNMCRHIHSVCMNEAAGTINDDGENVGDRIGQNTLIPSQMLINLPPKLNQTGNGSNNKTPQISQSREKKNANSQLVFYTDGSDNSDTTYTLEADNGVITSNKRIKLISQVPCVDVQNFQSDLLEVIDEEVLIADQETFDDSQVVYEMEMENEVEVMEENPNFDASGACFTVVEESNTLKTTKNASLQQRRANMEKIFKTILNCVQNEEQMVKVESAVSNLRNDVECSSSPSYTRSPLAGSKNVNKSPLQISKVLSTNGQPLVLGKTVILKVIK